MKRYAVNFGFSIIVEAESEDEAIKQAKGDFTCSESVYFDNVDELAPDTFKEDSEEAASTHELPEIGE